MRSGISNPRFTVTDTNLSTYSFRSGLRFRGKWIVTVSSTGWGSAITGAPVSVGDPSPSPSSGEVFSRAGAALDAVVASLLPSLALLRFAAFFLLLLVPLVTADVEPADRLAVCCWRSSLSSPFCPSIVSKRERSRSEPAFTAASRLFMRLSYACN